MRRPSGVGFALLSSIPVALLVACGADASDSLFAPSAQMPTTFRSVSTLDEGAPRFSEWSAPVNLGPPVNSDREELTPFLSKDGLSLYFGSFRPGGLGGPNDLWVARRASVTQGWEPPQNLGPTVNSSFTDGRPVLSNDEHRPFFSSSRPGGLGQQDLYMSRRRDRQDDLGWQTPISLGPTINSTANDGAPAYFEDEAGTSVLYFASTRPGGLGGNDIYATTLRPDETWSSPSLVAELSSPFDDQGVAVRRDGVELYLASNRPGTLGGQDIWVSTRSTTSDPWSEPVNLGAPIKLGEFRGRSRAVV